MIDEKASLKDIVAHLVDARLAELGVTAKAANANDAPTLVTIATYVPAPRGAHGKGGGRLLMLSAL